MIQWIKKHLSGIKWLLGALIAVLTALSAYVCTSCRTATSLSIVADEISNPNISFTDSTSVNYPSLKR